MLSVRMPSVGKRNDVLDKKIMLNTDKQFVWEITIASIVLFEFRTNVPPYVYPLQAREPVSQ